MRGVALVITGDVVSAMMAGVVFRTTEAAVSGIIRDVVFQILGGSPTVDARAIFPGIISVVACALGVVGFWKGKILTFSLVHGLYWCLREGAVEQLGFGFHRRIRWGVDHCQ
jgi:hypothetical protein